MFVGSYIYNMPLTPPFSMLYLNSIFVFPLKQFLYITVMTLPLLEMQVVGIALYCSLNCMMMAFLNLEIFVTAITTKNLYSCPVQ